MGKRVGTKRSDRRWLDDTGQEWASRYEYQVFCAFRDLGVNIRKCGKGDTIEYSEPKRNNKCLECGSERVVQTRTYTPDLCIDPDSEGGRTFIEVKGYMPAPKRKLFKDMLKGRPDIDIALVFEKDTRAPKSKLRYLEYTKRYFKIPAVAGIKNLEDLL